MFLSHIPADETSVSVALSFKDKLGADLPAPADLSVESSDATIATAAISGSTLIITRVAPAGQCVVTVRSGDVTCPVQVVITVATLAAITADLPLASV